MAIAIDFSKERAAYLVGCLEAGKPIEGVRNVHDMLALAGACFFVVSSHGPALRKDVDWSKVPLEHREAMEETLFNDIHAAIEWYAQATMWVHDGEYDPRFDPVHKAIITTDGTTKRCIRIAGFREPE